MELMITVIAIGVIASLAIPSYRRTVERARSNEAVTNLNIIYMAEKIYKIDNGGLYWAGTTCNGGGSPLVCTTINTNLSVDITSQYYNLTLAGGGAGFSASAARAGGSKTYAVDQNGVWTYGGSF